MHPTFPPANPSRGPTNPRSKASRKAGATPFRNFFSSIATSAANAAGSAWAFVLATIVVVAWAVSGPFFGYSDTWQLFINTGTTVATFLMVFLIQHAQNKDTYALHLKLNELLAAQQGASNRLIAVENLSDDEIAHLRARFDTLKERVGEIEPAAATSVENLEDEVEDKPAERGPARRGGRAA